MNNIIITQSNYIPWKGYFSVMRKATHFVVYDEMQYTKRDWRNRNKLITINGPKWLTIPVKVKGKYYQKISETIIDDVNWGINHWNFIENNYRNAPYFDEYKKYFQDIFLNSKNEKLSDINILFIKQIIKLLNININVIDSSEFVLKGDKTEKLLNICLELNASKYFTGPAAKNYMNENIFYENNIEIEYNNYSGFPEYKQQWNGFDHYVSILDMFFNLGPNTINYFN